MKNLENRLRELEDLIKADNEQWLVLMPDTTYAEAKSNYEQRIARNLTDWQFEEALSKINLVILKIVNSAGERSCQWIREYQRLDSIEK